MQPHAARTRFTITLFILILAACTLPACSTLSPGRLHFKEKDLTFSVNVGVRIGDAEGVIPNVSLGLFYGFSDYVGAGLNLSFPLSFTLLMSHTAFFPLDPYLLVTLYKNPEDTLRVNSYLYLFRSRMPNLFLPALGLAVSGRTPTGYFYGGLELNYFALYTQAITLSAFAGGGFLLPDTATMLGGGATATDWLRIEFGRKTKFIWFEETYGEFLFDYAGTRSFK